MNGGREYENVWGRTIDPHLRGRHATFGSALDAAVADLVRERDEFFDSLVDSWRRLFPGMPARPGRYENGRIFLYVASAPTLFLMRPRLNQIKRRLAELPGAPKRIDLRLEVHKP